MLLEIYEQGVKDFEVDCDLFRELYDTLSWIGGYAGFHQYNGKESETNYEFYIRDKDYRMFKYDAQRESGTIEIFLLDDCLAVITLEK